MLWGKSKFFDLEEAKSVRICLGHPNKMFRFPSPDHWQPKLGA